MAVNDEFKATLEGKQLMEKMQMSKNIVPKQDMFNLNKQLKSPCSIQEDHDIDLPLSFIKIDQQMHNIMSTVPQSKLLSQSDTAMTMQSNNTQVGDKFKLDSTN